jgi:hypothetical protein
MNQPPWWERMFDRDSPAGPVIVLVLIILGIGFVFFVGPLLDRLISGEKPASYVPVSPEPWVLEPLDTAAAPVGSALTRLAATRPSSHVARSRSGRRRYRISARARTRAGSTGRRHTGRRSTNARRMGVVAA